jgi:hypothetical protein
MVVPPDARSLAPRPPSGRSCTVVYRFVPHVCRSPVRPGRRTALPRGAGAPCPGRRGPSPRASHGGLGGTADRQRRAPPRPGTVRALPRATRIGYHPHDRVLPDGHRRVRSAPAWPSSWPVAPVDRCEVARRDYRPLRELFGLRMRVAGRDSGPATMRRRPAHRPRPETARGHRLEQTRRPGHG